MIIFDETVRTTGISDRMTLGGWTFDVQIVASEKNGNAAAIHCGRILFLQVECEDEIIAFYDDGIWYQTPSPDFPEGELAVELLIDEYSRPHKPNRCNKRIRKDGQKDDPKFRRKDRKNGNQA